MSDEDKSKVDKSKTDANVPANVENGSENAAIMQEHDKAAKTDIPVTDTGTDQDKKSGPPKHRPKHKKTRAKPILLWATSFALLLVLVLGAGNYWLYRQGQVLTQSIAQTARQQTRLDQQISELDHRITESGDQRQVLTGKIQTTQQSQQSILASLDQMSQQLKTLATAKGKDPLFWRVSEVEYLLTVANHSLLLERNVSTAKTALQDADKRLRRIGDPGLIPVREQISREINQLEQVALPDIPGMAAQLAGLVENLPQLAFVEKEFSLDTTSRDSGDKEFTGVGNFLQQVWHDLANGLFKVQRTDKPIEPLLPSEEKQYLLHNLRLKLEQARIALLQKETDLLQTNLQDIEHWTQQYFDPEASSVSALLQTVHTLKGVELRPALPDISASLRELRTWLNQQKNVAYRSRAIPGSQLARNQQEVQTP